MDRPVLLALTLLAILALTLSGPLGLLWLSFDDAVLTELRDLQQALGAPTAGIYQTAEARMLALRPEPPRAYDWPLDAIAALLLLGALGAAGAARLPEPVRLPRWLHLGVWAGLAALLTVGALHVLTDFLDVLDVLPVYEGARSREEGPRVLEIKPYAGVIAGALLTAWALRAVPDRRAWCFFGAATLVLVDLTLFSNLEPLGSWARYSPTWRCWAAAFGMAFDALHPDLTGYGALLVENDDLLFDGYDAEDLLYKNVIAGCFAAGVFCARAALAASRRARRLARVRAVTGAR